MNQQLQTAAAAIQSGRTDDAIRILLDILERNEKRTDARWMLIRSFEQSRDRERALEQVSALLRHGSDELETINQAAAFLHQRAWPLGAATSAYRAYLESRPRDANAAFNLAFYLGKDGEYEEAVLIYEMALELGVAAPEEAHVNIANLCMDALYDNERAQRHLERALELNPRYKGAWYNLGNLHERLGDRGRAESCFGKCLELEPGDSAALARLGEVHRFESSDDPLLARLRAAAPASQNSSLHFALGRAYERLADYDSAWSQFSRANRLDRRYLVPYDPGRVERQFRDIMTTCDAEWLARFAGVSHAPIFLCGMFRTGSTLLEQMLGAHPAITAGGEQEYFARLVSRNLVDYPGGLERLEPSTAEAWRADHRVHHDRLAVASTRLTDKRPDNFLFVGLIKAILPGAKFVVTERDWRDVAVSIFGNRLGGAQNYATRLHDIRHYLQQHRRLVDHWESVLGADVLRLGYERLVSDPRETLGNLLEFLGLEWDDRCLAFQRQKTAVATASAWQVREPLYASSVGRWRNYEIEFRKAFGDDIGD